VIRPQRTSPLLTIRQWSFWQATAAFGICGSALAQPPATVTVEARASTVTTFLSKLESSDGIKVSCPANLGNEVIVVKCSSAPADELLSNIAYILNSDWQARDECIVRPTDRQKELQEADEREIRSLISAFLESERAFIAKHSDAEATVNATVASLRQLGIDLRNPPYNPSANFNPKIVSATRVLLSSLLIEVGPDVLSQLPYGRTVVYSSSPTRSQRKLELEVQPLLDTYLKSQRTLIESFPWELYSDEEARPWAVRLLAEANRASLGIRKINLFLIRTESLICELAVYAPSGEIISVAGVTISLAEPSVDDDPFSLGASATAPLSSLSVEFNQLLPLGRLGKWQTLMSNFANPSELLRKAMSDPAKHDPLSYAVSDALLGLAKELGVDMAACVSDSLNDDMFAVIRDGEIRLLDFLKLLSKHHQVSLKNGWLLIRPKSPIRAEMARVPRPALKQFVQKALMEKGIYLRNYSVFCYNARQSAFVSSVAETYATFVALTNGHTSIGNIGVYPRSAYYLLGSLDEVQWRMLTERGEPLRIAAMRPEQQEFAANLIGLHARACERSREWSQTQIPDILLTGSEALPNGFDNDSALLARTANETALVSNRPIQYESLDGFLSVPRTLEYVRRELQTAFASYSDITRPSDVLTGKYLVGSQSRTTFVIEVRPGVEWKMVSEGAFIVQSGPFRYADLPSEVRRQIER
jgi:hypothetical protein